MDAQDSALYFPIYLIKTSDKYIWSIFLVEIIFNLLFNNYIQDHRRPLKGSKRGICHLLGSSKKCSLLL